MNSTTIKIRLTAVKLLGKIKKYKYKILSLYAMVKTMKLLCAIIFALLCLAPALGKFFSLLPYENLP